MRRRRILPFVPVAVFGILVLLAWLRPGEPRSEGRSLSSWLNDQHETSPYGLTASAKVAIARMGSNAVPYLLKAMQREDTILKRNLAEFLYKHGRRPPFRMAWQDHLAASEGLAALGLAGASAIPELRKMLDDPVRAYPAVNALAELGSEAVPALTNALTSTNARVRSSVGWVFNNTRTNGPAMVAAFMQALCDTNPTVVVAAIGALARIHEQPERVVPALASLLRNPSPAIRRRALAGLGRFETNAAQALPGILITFEDPSLSVRVAATDAVCEIHLQPASFLITQLQHPTPMVRETAAVSLRTRMRCDPEARNLVTNLLSHPDEAVRKLADGILQSRSPPRGPRMISR